MKKIIITIKKELPIFVNPIFILATILVSSSLIGSFTAPIMIVSITIYGSHIFQYAYSSVQKDEAFCFFLPGAKAERLRTRIIDNFLITIETLLLDSLFLIGLYFQANDISSNKMWIESPISIIGIGFLISTCSSMFFELIVEKVKRKWIALIVDPPILYFFSYFLGIFPAKIDIIQRNLGYYSITNAIIQSLFLLSCFAFFLLISYLEFVFLKKIRKGKTK